MSNNKDKFKLEEDPEVSGGAGRRRNNYKEQIEMDEDTTVEEMEITYNFCTKCGNQLIKSKCPYCNISYPITGTLERLDEEEVPIPRIKKRRGKSAW